MAADVLRMHLHSRELRVSEVIADTPQELRVRVESSVRRPRCAACGFRCARMHERREREIRDLGVSGRRRVLARLRRRFAREHCEHRFSEDHRESDGKLTWRVVRQVVADAEVISVMSEARHHGLGWHLVMALVKAWSHLIGQHRRAQRCCPIRGVRITRDPNPTITAQRNHSSAKRSNIVRVQPIPDGSLTATRCLVDNVGGSYGMVKRPKARANVQADRP